jgi:drug/metabolite transporter (DMT)-like permease
VLVLDLASGADLDPRGVLWALGATVGLATYFLISADEDNGLPPVALAAGGLLVGTVALGALALTGLLPMHATSAAATYADRSVPAWLPLLALGLVSAALAFTTGIEASRRLGSRLASFVGLVEVLAGVGAAWLLLDELPGSLQLVGGALILAGVVGVKLGEKDVEGHPAA